jgi:AraC-like DNA-binding protein
MEAGEKTISEIAIAVGFSDSRAMAKAFSKRFGMLPSEYRKQEITSKK